MKVAPEHAERQGVTARVNMIERFLLHRVALQPGHVSKGNSEFPLVMESDLANPAFTLADQAAMAARQTSQSISFDSAERRRALRRPFIQRLGKSRIRYLKLHEAARCGRTIMRMLAQIRGACN